MKEQVTRRQTSSVAVCLVSMVKTLGLLYMTPFGRRASCSEVPKGLIVNSSKSTEKLCDIAWPRATD